MLPKETFVQVVGAWKSGLLKVAGLAELFEPTVPRNRMLLDMRDPAVCSLADASASEYAGLLVDVMPDNDLVPAMVLDGDPAIVRPGDVIEWRPERGRVAVLYRRGDNANILFATERCNSYCLMCSQPPRQVEDHWRVDHLCSLVELIDREEPLLTITGGEPTLLDAGLLRLVERCRQVLPDTHLHILSNGRRLADAGFAASFRNAHPALTWGIPLYGDHFELHDYVVQRVGAFAETMRGLYAMQEAGQSIELRVVLVRPTVERLPELARFIARNLPFVDRVALMGIEPTGFANAHHSELWIDPVDMDERLLSTVNLLERHGLRTLLYNLPLCTLSRSLWKNARRSISDWKQDYLPACQQCQIRAQCGGFFSWITPRWTSRAISQITLEAVS